LGFGNAVKIVDFGGFMGILECVFTGKQQGKPCCAENFIDLKKRKTIYRAN
jgi:hypothetical protein